MTHQWSLNSKICLFVNQATSSYVNVQHTFQRFGGLPLYFYTSWFPFLYFFHSSTINRTWCMSIPILRLLYTLRYLGCFVIISPTIHFLYSNSSLAKLKNLIVSYGGLIQKKYTPTTWIILFFSNMHICSFQ